MLVRMMLAQRLDVAADDQAVVAGQFGVIGAGRMALDDAAAGHVEWKLDPFGLVLDGFVGKPGKVAGDGDVVVIDQEIDRARVLAAAAVDGVDDAGKAALPVLVGKRLHLGPHRLVDLALEKESRVPVDVAEERADGECEKRQIDGRQAERRGAEKLGARSHGPYSPSPARSAGSAPRIPCRSSSAIGKHERR
jgi:hypothetical protein